MTYNITPIDSKVSKLRFALQGKKNFMGIIFWLRACVCASEISGPDEYTNINEYFAQYFTQAFSTLL